MTSLRRLTKEFEALEKNPLDFVEITPADDKMSAEAQLQGPAGTPYANGVWTVDLTFPENYPFKAPTVKFRTEIKHPNVKTDTGEVCPEVFFPNWSPTMNVRLVLSNAHFSHVAVMQFTQPTSSSAQKSRHHFPHLSQSMPP